MMSRRSERLEKINKPDSVDGPELQSTRGRIKRQENVGKRPTSERVNRRRALSSGSVSDENPLFVQVPAIEEAEKIVNLISTILLKLIHWNPLINKRSSRRRTVPSGILHTIRNLLSKT